MTADDSLFLISKQLPDAISDALWTRSFGLSGATIGEADLTPHLG